MLKLLFIFVTLTLPCLGHSFSPEHPSDRRVLVLLDDLALKSSHSLFFSTVLSRGFELDFKLADDPKLSLHRYGQYNYAALILFSPSVDRFGGLVDVAAILDFDASAMVIDHTSYGVSDSEGDHTLIASDDFIRSDVILGSKKIESPVLFKGIGHTVNSENSLVLKVLSASPSAYSANPKSELSSPPSLTGSSISLVSVVQARNNARILISGSLSMFSNRFFRSKVQQAGSPDKHEKSSNEQFVTELSKWVFHERGHLKAMNVRHHKVGETNEPAIYRINDDVEYSVEIYEWQGKSWEPYVADDVQVQFYMMSPHVLKTLSTDKKGHYFTAFKVPDVYGVFQFKVEYNRLGYMSVTLSKQIPVRPFRHDEYERFIPAAYPYYGATFTMMAGFFVFTAVHLHNK